MTLNSLDEAWVGFTTPAVVAIWETGVERVVVVSALGRGRERNAGLVTASIKADDLLSSTGVALRVLAMPSFMDNLLSQAQTITEEGMFFSPMRADLKTPTVATPTLRPSQKMDSLSRPEASHWAAVAVPFKHVLAKPSKMLRRLHATNLRLR